jgi:hypothetical protein
MLPKNTPPSWSDALKLEFPLRVWSEAVAGAAAVAPTPAIVVYVKDDDDVETVKSAVLSAADAHYAAADRIAAAAAEQAAAEKAKAAADNQALNDSIAAALAAAVAKADAVAAALIAEEEVDACIRRERQRAGRLAGEARAKVAAQNKAAAAEQRRVVKAEKAAQAQQLAREAADRDSARDRKLHEQRNDEVVLPILQNRRERRAALRCTSSRFTELFARNKADADAAFWHGYSVYMSRFSLVPVPATDVLLFGEFDEATQQLAVCVPEARCRLCCERRATHMYVPCGHVCVCHACAAACPWVCVACDVAPDMVLLLHGMPK